MKTHFDLSTNEAVKTVSNIKYAPLQLPEGETKEVFYVHVREKIACRMPRVLGDQKQQNENVNLQLLRTDVF